MRCRTRDRTDPLTYRVVQWTTGNVGKSSVRAIAANPTLQLVGCYAWSPEKVGRDVGELCGMESLDVKATNDIAALLALKPDCVVYNPMFADVRYAGVVFPVVGWWLYDIFYITPFLAIPYLHTVNREIFAD